MLPTLATTVRAELVRRLGLDDAGVAARAAATVRSFLDTTATADGRSSAYRARADQDVAERATHGALLDLDRGLYALLLSLPGTTDRARQLGVKNLLGVARSDACLDADTERTVVRRLADALPPQRMFKLFDALRVGDDEQGIHRANNARTRTLVLGAVFGSPRLELWSVKYRSKMLRALTHVWGRRTASIVRSILGKDAARWTAKERAIVRRAIDRFVKGSIERAHACVRFVLGAPGPRLPLHRAVREARTDLSAGAALPPEVLEGIRSVFHRNAPKQEVLRLTADTLTTTQSLAVQKRAKAAGAMVKVTPTDHDPVRLYRFAFETGLTADVAAALAEKARATAARMPWRFGALGILVDASASMAGGADRPLYPMAAALALRDVLTHAGCATVAYAGGEPVRDPDPRLDSVLVRPSGDTPLAEPLLDLVEREPEAIFVITDGYENRPAGRFATVVAALRAGGVATPIVQLNPVFAAEALGVRELCAELVATVPMQGPEGLALGLARAALAFDPAAGLGALVALALA